MNLRTFIERPVFSAVISITIVILGIIGLFTLPVEQYPDIAPPTVMVSTTYYGASAETLQKSVIAPLEEAINVGIGYIIKIVANIEKGLRRMNFIFSILFFYSKFSRTQYEALTKISSVFSLFKSEPSV